MHAHRASTRLQRPCACAHIGLLGRLNALQGSNAVLRSRLERLEKELSEAQQHLRTSGSSSGQPFGRPGGNLLAEQELADQAKQLQTLQQQLAFAQQEVLLPVPCAVGNVRESVAVGCGPFWEHG